MAEKKKTASKKATTKKATTKRAGVSKKVIIKEIDIRMVTVHMRGITPLLMNNFGHHALKGMMDKMQANENTTKKKDPLDLNVGYIDSFHMVKGEPGKRGAVYGIPTRAVKQTIVNCAPFCGTAITRNKLNGSIFVVGTDRGPNESMVRLLNHSEPRPFFAVGRTSGMSASPIPKSRACFDDWEIKFQIRFDASQVTVEQLMNIVARCGFHVGFLDWSPRLSGGDFGQAELVGMG